MSQFYVKSLYMHRWFTGLWYHLKTTNYKYHSPFSNSIKHCIIPDLANMAAQLSSIATVPTNITTSSTKSSSAAPACKEKKTTFCKYFFFISNFHSESMWVRPSQINFSSRLSQNLVKEVLLFVIFQKFVIHFCVKFKLRRLCWQIQKKKKWEGPSNFLLFTDCSNPQAPSLKKVCAICL